MSIDELNRQWQDYLKRKEARERSASMQSSLSNAAGNASNMFAASKRGDYATSMLSGAASGAALGSGFGPVGTGVGLVLGAGAGALQTAISGENKDEDQFTKQYNDLTLKKMNQDYIAKKREQERMDKIRYYMQGGR